MAWLQLDRTKPVIQISTAPTFNSRESLGVWVLNGHAYKLYTRPKTAHDAFTELLGADYNGLPIPDWDYIVDAKYFAAGSSHWQSVSIIITRLVSGSHFTLQHGMGTFRALITQINNQRDISRCRQACIAAVRVGLKDPQGFIRQGGRWPLVFIDVHTSFRSRTGDFGRSDLPEIMLQLVEQHMAVIDSAIRQNQ